MLNAAARIMKTFLWYLQRPTLYPQLFYRVWEEVVYRAQNSLESEAIATAWCEQHAISTSDALRRITGDSNPNVRELYTRDFEFADAKIKDCPVKMGGAGNLDLIFQLAEFFQAEKILETGVAYGWSSLALLLHIEKRGSGKLVSIDMPYKNRENEAYVGCVVPERLRKDWTLLRKADRQGIPEALGHLPEIDFCHYDSDKHYGGRLWAYRRIWPPLKQHGCFVSDDIGDNLAFREFVESLPGQSVMVIKAGDESAHRYAGILIKNEVDHL